MPLAGAETEDVSSVVKRHIPNSFAVQDVGSDLLICLPEFDGEGQSQRDKFSRLFQELETKMDQLGLDSYGVSDTTLEEVNTIRIISLLRRYCIHADSVFV